jgi:hypothetical protein
MSTGDRVIICRASDLGAGGIPVRGDADMARNEAVLCEHGLVNVVVS